MQFKRLYMKNVLAVGREPLEIIFSTTNGITYIKGLNLDVTSKSSNGAGKSTIIEGILIALYGRTLRKEDGKPLTMEAMLHDEGEDTEAHVEFEYDDTKIVRKFTRKKSHVAYWVNGVPKSTDASATQVKKDLQDHINVNFETMCSILLFGQHHIFSFLEAGEPERREVFENLLNLKEYNLYEERARELRKETKKKIELLNQSYENTMAHIESQKRLLEQQEDRFRSHMDGLNREIAAVKREIAGQPDTDGLKRAWEAYNVADTQRRVLQTEMDTLQKRISDYSTELYEDGVAYQERLKEGRKPLDEAVAAIERKFASLESKRDVFQAQVSADRQAAEAIGSRITNITGDYNNRIKGLENSSVIFNLSSEVAKISTDGKSLSTKINNVRNSGLVADEVCPTCYGKIDPTNAEGVAKHYEADLLSLRANYTELAIKLKEEEATRDAEIEKLQAQCAADIEAVKTEKETALKAIDAKEEEIAHQYQIKHSSLKEQLTAANRCVEDFVNAAQANLSKELSVKIRAKDDCKCKYDTLEKQVKSLTTKAPDVPLNMVGALIAERDALLKNLEEKEKSLNANPYADIIDSLGKSVQDIQAKADKEANEIREQEKLLPYYEFWVGAMGNEGIKSFIIEGILPTLNEQIDYWMQLIYQGAITVKFDKFLNVEIKNNASKKGMKRYGQGSGGERRRIDIAIMLAFRQIMKMSTGKDPSIVVFDEVADNIDEEGLVWLYNVLVDVAKNTRVFVISHNPGLVSMLSGGETISVVKKNGAMTLV